MQHLAQFNIGRLKYGLDDPRVADFVNGVEMVNRIAGRSAGFVWKYETGAGGVVDEQVDGDDRTVVNMTVWEDAEALREFTFMTLHKHFYKRRAEWFEPLDKAHFVMWHVAPGHEPTLAEGMERLEYLRNHGDSDHAFGWAHLQRPRDPATRHPTPAMAEPE